MGAVAQDLYLSFNVDEKETDPIAVAAVTYAVSYANSPFMYAFQHHLYSIIEQSMFFWIPNQSSQWLILVIAFENR